MSRSEPHFDIGDAIDLKAKRDTTVGVVYKLYIKTPDGEPHEFEQGDMVLDEDEEYYVYTFLAEQPGKHTYRYEITGSKYAAEEGVFHVRRSAFY